jgi:hypothetical protein
MRAAIIGAAIALITVGCASQPPPKPTAIDPSNPAAPESPAVVLAPLVEIGAAARSAEPASAPSTDPSSGHQHDGASGASMAPDKLMPSTSAPSPAPHSSRHHHGASSPPAAPDEPMSSKPASSDPAEHVYDHAKQKSGPTEAVTYTCPNHPEISSPSPGQCPKCGMKLVPRKPAAAPGEQK